MTQIWKPHPKQETALLSQEFETLYGGARGGGKTDAGLAWLIYPIQNPLFRGLVIRKNGEDLTDWLDRANRMYSGQGAVITGKPAMIRFPSGAKIYTGHLKDDSAYTKYQGHEYQRMLIEELTQIPSEDLYMKLISSCRSTNGIIPRVFCSANPGGVGHYWVKKRFVDPARPGEIFHDPISERGRIFIPATVDDNPTIVAKDPDYIKFLDSLAPELRAQWRYGSWEAVKFDGQIYGDEMLQLREAGRLYEFSQDPYALVDVAFDLGTSDSQCLTFAQENNIIDFEESSSKQWGYYAQLLREKGYKYRMFILPHDGKKRNAKDLESFEDFLKKEFPKVKVVIVKRTKEVFADLQICRTKFPKLSFKASTTSRLVESLDAYRYEKDEKNQILKNEPKHDWSSHPADSLRCLLMCEERTSGEEEEKEHSRAMDDFLQECQLEDDE